MNGLAKISMNKYILYCRKSINEAGKQVLSIEAQITEVKEFATRENLKIVEIIIYLMWCVYILLCDEKKFYVGITNDLKNRLRQHRNGQSTYTKQFSEIKLVYKEEFEDRDGAVKREKEIKGWSKKKKVERCGLPSPE